MPEKKRFFEQIIQDNGRIKENAEDWCSVGFSGRYFFSFFLLKTLLFYSISLLKKKSSCTAECSEISTNKGWQSVAISGNTDGWHPVVPVTACLSLWGCHTCQVSRSQSRSLSGSCPGHVSRVRLELTVCVVMTRCLCSHGLSRTDTLPSVRVAGPGRERADTAHSPPCPATHTTNTCLMPTRVEQWINLGIIDLQWSPCWSYYTSPRRQESWWHRSESPPPSHRSLRGAECRSLGNG